ncbi:hypothetical protein ANO11243_083780 [Dothideomycetidae sp. 11243]|nr:hypothetical protein ANO11243_083780 [fungal sp. No.11243]
MAAAWVTLHDTWKAAPTSAGWGEVTPRNISADHMPARLTETRAIAIYDMLLATLGFSLDFIYPKHADSVVRRIFRLINSRLAIPTMALVDTGARCFVFSARPDLLDGGDFSWPLTKPIEESSTREFPPTSFPNPWQNELGGEWTISPTTVGAESDESTDMNSLNVYDFGGPASNWMATSPYMDKSSSAVTYPVRGLQGVAHEEPEIPFVAPAQDDGLGRVKSNETAHSTEQTATSRDPIRFSIHNTWIPGEPDEKQTLIPLQTGVSTRRGSIAWSGIPGRKALRGLPRR